MKRGGKVSFLGLLAVIAIMLSSTPTFANPALREAIEQGVRQFLYVGYKQNRLAFHRAIRTGGYAARDIFELIEVATVRASDQLYLEMKDLSRAKALQHFEQRLHPERLADILKIGMRDISDEVVAITHLLDAMEVATSRVALARGAIVQQLRAAMNQQSFFAVRAVRNIHDRVTQIWKRITLQGERLNPDKVMETMLSNADDPMARFNSIVERVEAGEWVGKEELFVSLSFLEPINDAIFSNAFERVLFRENIILEYMRRNPKRFQILIFKFLTVFVPRLRDRVDIAHFIEIAPQLVFRVSEESQLRSAFFLLNRPQRYAQNRALYEMQDAIIAINNRNLIENVGLAGEGQTYIALLQDQIDTIEAMPWWKRFLYRGKKGRLSKHIESVNAFDEQYLFTDFDIFNKSYEAFAPFVEHEHFEALYKMHRARYWMKNFAGMFFFTSLYYMVHTYIEKFVHEGIIDPAEHRITATTMLERIEGRLAVEYKRLNDPDWVDRIPSVERKIEMLEGRRDEYLERRRQGR